MDLNKISKIIWLDLYRIHSLIFYDTLVTMSLTGDTLVVLVSKIISALQEKADSFNRSSGVGRNCANSRAS